MAYEKMLSFIKGYQQTVRSSVAEAYGNITEAQGMWDRDINRLIW